MIEVLILVTLCQPDDGVDDLKIDRPVMSVTSSSIIASTSAFQATEKDPLFVGLGKMPVTALPLIHVTVRTFDAASCSVTSSDVT